MTNNMGTGNFYYVNTKMCYAVLMGDDVEQWEYDDAQYEMIELFEQRFGKGGTFRGGKDRDELRSFPSRCVVQASCPDTGNWITAVLRSGYYEGACWDWVLEDEDELVSDATIDAVEELFASVSTKLIRIGTFSNGETIYKQST